MARPLCPRHIAHNPPATYFKPAGIPLCELEEIELGADELEALRLADVEDLYHTEAAKQMRVSRQTFDRIVRHARMKVAATLVHGRALRVLLASSANEPVHEAHPTPGRAARSTCCCRASRRERKSVRA
ncbi:MAG: DUF134 domain-containing protein [Opitutaceae bacterium]|jgi:predicted DNA-binding protein (UPF0251 family)